MRRPIVLLLAALVAIPSLVPAQGLAADWILYNGKILTADGQDPFTFTIAEAVAIQAGRILLVGSTDAVLKVAGPTTQRLDLKGKTVIPGIIDSHSHVHSYALGHYGGHLVEPRLVWKTKQAGLDSLKALAARKKSQEWVVVGVADQDASLPVLFEEVTRADLDKVAPNNPVCLTLTQANNHALVNSLALAKLLERYPGGLPGIVKDDKGRATGLLKGVASETLHYEFVPQPAPELLAPVYRRELDEWAAMGVTTISTRLDPNSMSAFALLDGRGELPVRMAYSSEIANDHPNPEAIVSRLGNIIGHGTDRLWVVGLSPTNIDGILGMAWACLRKPYPREHPDNPLWKYQVFGPYGECTLTDPAFNDRALVLAANRHGLRITAMHVVGDRAMDEALDLLEEANKERPIVGRRFAIDHSRFVDDAMADRAQKLGVMFSLTPDSLYSTGNARDFALFYDEETAGDRIVPARRLLDRGIRAVIETDRHGEYSFKQMEIVVTRKDKDGRVWGPKQRVDKREALYMRTRWAAEYVLKEDVLGSIEPGKWADLAVLDRDLLSNPDEEISETNVLATFVGGKLVYTDPNLALSERLPQVGYREARYWKR